MNRALNSYITPKAISALLALIAGSICLLGLTGRPLSTSFYSILIIFPASAETILYFSGLLLAGSRLLLIFKPAFIKPAVYTTAAAVVCSVGLLIQQLRSYITAQDMREEFPGSWLFLVLGIGMLLTLTDRKRALAEMLLWAILLISLTGILGYLSGAEILIQHLPVHVILVSALLSLGQLLYHKEQGFIGRKILYRFSRRWSRLIWPGIIPILLLGYLLVTEIRSGIIDTRFVLTLMVTLCTMLYYCLLIIRGRKLHSLEKAIEGSSLGLWEWNLLEGTVKVSGQWLLLLGYPEKPGHFREDEWIHRIHSADMAVLKGKMVDYLKGHEGAFDVSHRMLQQDGTYLWVRNQGIVAEWDVKGRPIRLTGTYSNISMFQEQGELLVKAREELRSLAIHLQDIREVERLNLSRLIHEELGQQLSSLKMDLSGLGDKIDIADLETQGNFHRSQERLENTIQEVKRLSAELSPGIIDDLGLVVSLQALVQEFRLRYNIRIRFSSLLDHIETSRKTALCMYRVLQEGLSNAARHSKATSVAVRLTISEEGKLILAIRDDGIGFRRHDPDFESHFGLVEIRERMLMIQGEMQILSEPGRGTCLWVSAPMSYEKWSESEKGEI